MIRNKQASDIDAFYSTAESIFSLLNPKDKILFFPVLLSKKYIKNILQNVDKYAIDVTLSNFIVHCSKWSKRLSKNIEIVFDQSKQIQYYEEEIKFWSAPFSPQEIGFGSKKLTFPLPISSIHHADSREFLEIQFADLLVSSINYALIEVYHKKIADNKFAQKIMQSKLFDLECHMIWPSLNIKGNIETDGINPLDFMSDIVKDRQNEYDEILNKSHKSDRRQKKDNNG